MFVYRCHMLEHAHQFKGRPRASAGGFFFTMQNEKKKIRIFFGRLGSFAGLHNLPMI